MATAWTPREADASAADRRTDRRSPWLSLPWIAAIAAFVALWQLGKDAVRAVVGN